MKSKGFSCIGSVLGNMRSVQTICGNTLKFYIMHTVWPFPCSACNVCFLQIWSMCGSAGRWGWFVASKPPTRTRITSSTCTRTKRNQCRTESTTFGYHYFICKCPWRLIVKQILCVFISEHIYTEFREYYVALYVYIYVPFEYEKK